MIEGLMEISHHRKLRSLDESYRDTGFYTLICQTVLRFDSTDNAIDFARGFVCYLESVVGIENAKKFPLKSNPGSDGQMLLALPTPCFPIIEEYVCQ
jgi:hypothetical protein